MTWPLPSTLGGRASSRTTCSLLELELGRVLDGDDALVVAEDKLDRMLSSVVLPVEVPPEMTMFSRACTQACRKSPMSSVQRVEADQVVHAIAPRGRTCGC